MAQRKFWVMGSFFVLFVCLSIIAEAQEEPTILEIVYRPAVNTIMETMSLSNVPAKSQERENASAQSMELKKAAAMYAHVYYDDYPGDNHFSDFGQALEHVEEGGTLYLGKPADIKSSFSIVRSLCIQSLNPSEPMLKVIQTPVNNKVFHLKNIHWFRLEGVYAIGSNVSIVSGHADRIEISGCQFERCVPLHMNSNADFSIHMENSRVCDADIEICPYTAGEKSVIFQQNHFSSGLSTSKAIGLKNVQGMLSGNHFEGYSLVFRNGEDTEIDVFENVFCGSQKGKILVSREGQNIRFHHNHILKNFSDAIVYFGVGKLDFRYNWWGEKEGPEDSIGKEKLHYEPWALFPDFRRFKGDPYTLKDLQELCRQIGADLDTDNWIYDIREDGKLDFLDAIGLIRQWIE